MAATPAMLRRPRKQPKFEREPRHLIRQYRYVCVCGRLVQGQYGVAVVKPRTRQERDALALAMGRINPKAAVCNTSRGPAHGQKMSVKEQHMVGCGRTLEESDTAIRELTLARKTGDPEVYQAAIERIRTPDERARDAARRPGMAVVA